MINYLGLGMKLLVLIGGWLGVIFFLWRKFRLDLEERQIFSYGLWSAIFAIWLGFYLRIWIGVSGIVLLLGYFSQKYSWDGFELLDYLMPLIIVYAGIVSFEWKVLPVSLLGWYVNAKYRKFNWYKSGKPGLSGFVSIAVFGLYLVINGFKSGFIDQVAGIWLLTVGLVSIYLRSRLKLIK